VRRDVLSDGRAAVEGNMGMAASEADADYRSQDRGYRKTSYHCGGAPF
jgi:hypothetical protein